MTPNFTAHIGLRWEFYGQTVNLLHNETVARETNPATAFWDMSLPLSVRTVPYVQPVYHNYQPRLGICLESRLQQETGDECGLCHQYRPRVYQPILERRSMPRR